MTTEKTIKSIPRTILKVILILNVLTVLVCATILFVSIDTYGIYASSIGAMTALVNSIGLTLLIRWRHAGFFIMLAMGICSTIALMITCAGWLMHLMGEMGLVFPLLLILGHIGILFILLHIKSNGKSLWSRMTSGFDWAHFRHIYQLSSVVLVAIMICTFFMLPQSIITANEGDEEMRMIANVPFSRLDAANVTIEEVTCFEKEYNEAHQVDERDEKITKRIYALKHLLLGELMIDIHSRDNLVNIYMIHASSFSEEQNEIIKWFTDLDVSQQYEWNVCEKVTNLQDFKTIVQKKINEG